MRLIALIALLLLPGVALAQVPSASSGDNFVSALATNLNHALAENDKLRAEVDALQKQVDAAKKPAAEVK